MKTISIKQLHAETGRWVRTAKKQTLIVTDRGEEIAELRVAAESGDPAVVRMELGDVLFSVVNVARKLGLDAETALRGAADKFVARFTRVQQLATQRGVDLAACDLTQLDALWDEAKRQLN